MLAPLTERHAQIELSRGGVGINGHRMGPQRLRVTPDPDLVPGEDSEPADDTYEKAGERESPHPRCRPPQDLPAGQQASAGEDRPAEACEVGVSIRGNLRAVLKDADHRQEHYHVRLPRRRQARQSTAECQSHRSDR